MKELLRLENLCYSYDAEYPALQGVSAVLYAGERVAVIGNNGAGKSTLFLCCNGVVHPTQGQICLHGEPLGQKAADRLRLRQSIGLVFQDPDVQLIAGNVAAEISFGPMNLRLPEAEVLQRVEDAIQTMQLEAIRERAPHTLSGGEKKRVCIAAILAMKPEVLLLDEPFSSLDPKNALLLEEHLAQLNAQKLTLVVATHDVDFVWRWADRVLVMGQGKILADDTPEAVFSDEALLLRSGLRTPLLVQVGKKLNLPVLPHFVDEIPERLFRKMP